MTNSYSLRDELLTNHGARVYPVAYGYDAQGRRATLTTWQNFAARSGAAVTAWHYDTNRGFLRAKVYDDGRGTEGGARGQRRGADGGERDGQRSRLERNCCALLKPLARGAYLAP